MRATRVLPVLALALASIAASLAFEFGPGPLPPMVPMVPMRRCRGRVHTCGARVSSHVLTAAAPHAHERSGSPSDALPRDGGLMAASFPRFQVPSSAMGVAVSMLLPLQEAVAKDGDFGIFEGRTASLVHPAVMFALFGASLYSGFLGWQWRRLRTVGSELSSLKAELPVVAGQKVSSVGDKIQQIRAELTTLEGSEDVETPQKVASLKADLKVLEGLPDLDTKIVELTETRKKLVEGNYRDRHYSTSAVLLGAGVSVSILGPINTYLRTGKLFPGPHLYAGAAVCALWALAAALVPYMQKGNELARNLHIALNAINVVLFTWQVGTGIEIVLKVLEFTKWP